MRITWFVFLPFTLIDFSGDELKGSVSRLAVVLPFSRVFVAKERKDSITMNLIDTINRMITEKHDLNKKTRRREGEGEDETNTTKLPPSFVFSLFFGELVVAVAMEIVGGVLVVENL